VTRSSHQSSGCLFEYDLTTKGKGTQTSDDARGSFRTKLAYESLSFVIILILRPCRADLMAWLKPAAIESKGFQDFFTALRLHQALQGKFMA